MTMNRQFFAMLIGLFIVASHVTLSALFLFVFDLPEDALLSEISTPLTVAYVSAIVMWFFANGGMITSNEPIGIFLVIIVVLVVGGLLASLFAVPIIFVSDRSETLDVMTDRYLFVETVFGGIFGIVMAELFGYRRAVATGPAGAG